MSKSNKNKSKLQNSRLASMNNNASTPTLSSNYYYQHPKMSYSAEYIPSPPPYNTQVLHSPQPTPSTSWTSEMSALAEKIRDDVASTFKGNSNSSVNNVDRHSISQGMKLVSIAADEYEQGNESVALDIYLTGVDKILMALPSKHNSNDNSLLLLLTVSN